MKRTTNKAARKPTMIVVKRAFEFKNGNISFDMEIDGWLTIYQCTLVQKKNSEDYFVAFPQYKGTDNNYYHYIYFDLLEEEQNMIEEQIEHLLNDKDK